MCVDLINKEPPTRGFGFYVAYALNNPDESVECAKKCAVMIGANGLENKCTFLQVLLWKCYRVFYSYKTKSNEATTTKSSAERAELLLANSTFISGLYNQGLLPEQCIWYLITELKEENGNDQIHCLANVINLTGTKLSETRSLSRIVGHLLSLEAELYREEVMHYESRWLINRVKIMHAKYWIHKTPDKQVKEKFRKINEDLIKPNKTPEVRKQYETCLIGVTILEDCCDLHAKLLCRKDSDVVEQLLSPALKAVIQMDQFDFIVNTIVTAVHNEKERVIMNAGKVLADIVKAKLISRVIVIMGLDKVRNGNINYSDSVSTMQKEFNSQLKKTSRTPSKV